MAVINRFWELNGTLSTSVNFRGKKVTCHLSFCRAAVSYLKCSQKVLWMTKGIEMWRSLVLVVQHITIYFQSSNCYCFTRKFHSPSWLNLQYQGDGEIMHKYSQLVFVGPSAVPQKDGGRLLEHQPRLNGYLSMLLQKDDSRSYGNENRKILSENGKLPLLLCFFVPFPLESFYLMGFPL